MRLNALGLLLIAVPIVCALALALDFARRLETSVSAGGTLPRDAIVFTGQFNRIHAGLALLRARRVERLFISGVNPGAGIRIARFADQFGLDDGLRQALMSGRIALGPAAQNTPENAVETACWLRARSGTESSTTEGTFDRGRDVREPVLLITSRSHMPRASLALEQALPDRSVHRLSVERETGAMSLSIWTAEFVKFALTMVSGAMSPVVSSDCPADVRAEITSRG